MTFNEMYNSVKDAQASLNVADAVAYRLAELLIGRLRHCSPNALAKLKRELRGFNIKTKEWND